MVKQLMATPGMYHLREKTPTFQILRHHLHTQDTMTMLDYFAAYPQRLIDIIASFFIIIVVV